MVRHLPMVVQLGPQSHTWGSCPWRNLSGAERSPRVGIRVADRTQLETRSRSGVLGRYRNRPDGSLHQRRTAMHHHPQTREKSSQFVNPPRTPNSKLQQNSNDRPSECRTELSLLTELQRTRVSGGPFVIHRPPSAGQGLGQN